MDCVRIKKQNQMLDTECLDGFTKEELIAKIRSLQSHNLQLKNILVKNIDKKRGHSKNQKAFDFTRCTYRHILLKFFYLGWNYHGYTIQEDTLNTIENYLFKALIKTCLIQDRCTSNYHRCGRTDKGVSSFGQVISITVRSKLSPQETDKTDDEMDYCKVLNRVLPDDIQCVAWCPINEGFSARFNCQSRTYKYCFPHGNLNIEIMREAAKSLIGTHDFRNICKMDVGNGVVQFFRNIIDIRIEPTRPNSKDAPHLYTMYVLTIKGQAFLWHQIRCIMGLLLLIGQNREKPQIILDLLDVEKNPRKPDYNMASEIPLNLYLCDYELDSDWVYSEDSLQDVMRKLRGFWVNHSTKKEMIEYMMQDLSGRIPKDEDSECMSEYLIQGVKAKNYIPVMKRQKCDSLESKIKHYVKRKRIELNADGTEKSA